MLAEATALTDYHILAESGGEHDAPLKLDGLLGEALDVSVGNDAVLLVDPFEPDHKRPQAEQPHIEHDEQDCDRDSAHGGHGG